MNYYRCTAYGGHLHFVELTDNWGDVALERLHNDQTSLVVSYAHLSTLTIDHCVMQITRIPSVC